MELPIDDFWNLYADKKSILLFISGNYFKFSRKQFENMTNTPFMYLGQEYRKDGDIIKRIK